VVELELKGRDVEEAAEVDVVRPGLQRPAPPEKGRANEALIKLLAGGLDVPRSRIAVVGGQTARRKIVEVDGLDLPEIDRRLSG
jgi:uncharacterized protein YggU (UPF0235/DUF167 family)